MSEQMARIRWVESAHGGRASPPSGPQYTTVARFEAIADRWPDEAWSVVLDIPPPADDCGIRTVGIRMLAGDAAPEELLASGSRFELYEGARRVAIGEVL